MAGRVPRQVEHLQRPGLVAVLEALVDQARSVSRPIQEDPDLERVGLERARRLEADGLGGAVARDDVRLPGVAEQGRARRALERRDPAE